MTEIAASRWSELFTARYAAALGMLSLGVGLYALNSFLVATSLPTAVLEIDGVELISWAFTVFLVTAIVGGAAAAYLKQRFGARLALLVPAGAFLAGTLCAAFAQSMEVVLVGRALQGAGEGVIAALCYALIPELFPSRLVPKVFGVEAIVWALAAFGGPLVAGLLTETVSWRAAFLVNVPLILLFIGLIFLVVRRDGTPAGNMPLPILRLLGCAAGIMLVSIAGLDVRPVRTALLVLAALGLLVLVFAVDRRRPDRLFPGDAFSLRSTVGKGLWVVLLMPLAQAAAAVYVTLMVQHLWGYGPTVAGYFSALMAISWSLTAIGVANLRHARLIGLALRLGPLLNALGLGTIALAMLYGQVWLMLLAQVAVGAGFGVCWAFLSQTVMESARPEERDRASALVPTVQSGGFAVGAAVAGLVANGAGLTKALGAAEIVHAACWIFGVAGAIGLLAFAAGLRLAPPPSVRQPRGGDAPGKGCS